MAERRSRPAKEPAKEGGTLLMAGLLVLALAFAGVWIIGYVSGTGAPWTLLRWFAAAAAVMIVMALVAWGFPMRRRSDGDRKPPQ